MYRSASYEGRSSCGEAHPNSMRLTSFLQSFKFAPEALTSGALSSNGASCYYLTNPLTLSVLTSSIKICYTASCFGSCPHLHGSHSSANTPLLLATPEGIEPSKHLTNQVSLPSSSVW